MVVSTLAQPSRSWAARMSVPDSSRWGGGRGNRVADPEQRRSIALPDSRETTYVVPCS